MPAHGLSGLVDGLFVRQREAWPLLGKGLLGLSAARSRPVRAAGDEMVVRHIPHRVASTTAAVETGPLMSVSTVPLRRSSANVRMVIGGTSMKRTR